MRLAFATLAIGAALVPAAASADSSLVLRLGSRGPVVARWQQILDTWLGASGSTRARRFERDWGRVAMDGVFGRETEAATRAFQVEIRVPATGVVDSLARMNWVGANVTCCGAGYPTAGPGAVGGYVGWWQIALDRWLAQCRGRQLLVDGVFGPRTRSATTEFQRDVGLAATGIAGTRTWKAMARRDLLHMP